MNTSVTRITPGVNHEHPLHEQAPTREARDLDMGSGLRLHWSWCACCRRAYPAGTYRIVRFGATRRHPFPKELHLCPYLGCSGSLTRDQWRWTSVRAQHPEYPEAPEPDVRYGDA
jgi:hypothetical protein